MSLRRAKTLYCIAVMAIGILLASTGELAYWIASVIVLGGALPLYRVMGHAVFDESLDDAESALVAEQRRRDLQVARAAVDQHATRE